MILHRCCMTAWLFAGTVLLASCSKGPQPGAVLDEARQVGRDGASFKHSADDYFHDMDGAVKLEPAEIAGMLIALRMKGETADEMIGAAHALSAAATRSIAPIICSPIAAAPGAMARG